MINGYCAKYNSPAKNLHARYYKNSLTRSNDILYIKNISNVGEKRKGILYLFVLFSLSLNHPFYFWGRREGTTERFHLNQGNFTLHGIEQRIILHMW
jgi:hypothetical protein